MGESWRRSHPNPDALIGGERGRPGRLLALVKDLGLQGFVFAAGAIAETMNWLITTRWPAGPFALPKPEGGISHPPSRRPFGCRRPVGAGQGTANGSVDPLERWALRAAGWYPDQPLAHLRCPAGKRLAASPLCFRSLRGRSRRVALAISLPPPFYRQPR